MSDRRVAVNGITPKQRDYIEWLCQPQGTRSPAHQRDWARENHVTERALQKWKADMRFRAAWDKRLHELRINPENVSEVIEAMRQKAVKGDTRAAQLWLEIAQRFMPQAEAAPPPEDDDLTGLSDDELEALIASQAKAELERRQTGE